ncbi:MAG: hypothetical protein LCH57_04145 [Proteobacteria bacterium]|nr:hypothetical protein [Pseudomonadota bacterium]
MDLARLAFVAINVPGFGPVVIDAASGAFETWRHAGIQSKRWATGDALVRDMIVERGRLPVAEDADPQSGAPAFSHEQASALTREQIEGFAEAFIAKSRYAVRPRFKKTPSGKVVDRDDDEIVELLAPRTGEAQSDRLLRLSRLRDEDRRLSNERMMARIKPAWNEMSRTAQIIKAATESPLAELMRARDLANPIMAATAGISHQSRVIDAAMGNLALGGQLGALAGDWSGLGRVAQLIGAEQSAWTAVANAFASPDYLSAFKIAAGVEQQTRWARDLSRTLDLDRSTLMGLSGLTELGALAREVSDLKTSWALGRPGAVLTGDAVLAGLAGFGAGAAVLGHYDEPLSGEWALGRVLDGLRHLDDGEITPEDFAHRVHGAIDAIAPLLQTLDRLGSHGAMTLLALLVAVMALFVGPADGPAQVDPAVIAAEQAAVARLNELIALQERSLEVAREAHDYRHVLGKTTLRLEPIAGAQAIRVVFPDELIRVVDTDGHWAKVAVTDYASDQLTVGWIARSRIAPPD